MFILFIFAYLLRQGTNGHAQKLDFGSLMARDTKQLNKNAMLHPAAAQSNGGHTSEFGSTAAKMLHSEEDAATFLSSIKDVQGRIPEMVATTLKRAHEQGNVNAKQYTLAISSCARAEMWQFACSLLHSMPAARIHPNQFSSNAALNSFLKGR